MEHVRTPKFITDVYQLRQGVSHAFPVDHVETRYGSEKFRVTKRRVKGSIAVKG